MDGRIEKLNIDELVVERVLKWIEAKEYEPGHKLPSENQLSKELGIGRHALREGLKRLVHLGVLESRNGVGTFVSKNSPESLIDIFSPFLLVGNFTEYEIYEVGNVIESFAVRLVAQNATDEEIENLYRINKEMEDEIDNYERYVKKNLELHLAIAQYSNNKFLALLLRTFRELLDKSIKSVPVFPGSLRKSVDGHYRVIDALKNRDGDAAAQAMSEHLSEVKDRFNFAKNE